MSGATKSEIFGKKSKEGGGVIFNPKIYVTDFGPQNRAFLEKGGGVKPMFKNYVVNFV